MRKALGLPGPPQRFVSLRQNHRRVPFPQPVARLPRFYIFDLRDVRDWAEKKDRAFDVEADIDAGPTIDPDLLATMNQIVELLGATTSWIRRASQSPQNDFPTPVLRLPQRDLWNIEEIETWAARHGRDTYFPPEPPARRPRPPADT